MKKKISCIIFVLIIIWYSTDLIIWFSNYYKVSDINGKITNIRSYTEYKRSAPDVTRYYISVNYQYNNTSYDDSIDTKEFMNIDGKDLKVGDTIKLKIHPNKPHEIFNNSIRYILDYRIGVITVFSFLLFMIIKFY